MVLTKGRSLQGDRIAPGPRRRLLLGHLPDFKNDPLGTLLSGAVEYGDVVRFVFGPAQANFTLHLVRRPEHVQYVLQDNQHSFKKAPTYEPIRDFLGDGLLTNEGDGWLRHRRLAQHSFYKKRIVSFAPVMTDSCSSTIERLRARAAADRGIDISEEMARLTLTIVGRTLFSTDLSEQGSKVGPALAVVQEHIIKRIQSPAMFIASYPKRWPTPEYRRYEDAVEVLDRVVNDVIRRRRNSEEECDDLLSTLMSAGDDEDRALDDRELRDEVMTFLLAGHETTSNALSWTWYLLSKHPAVVERLEAELDEVLDGRLPTAEDLDRLSYTTAVIKESMRLYPPAWLIEREAIEDLEIGGYAIDAGSVVATSPFVTHRHPEFWPNPEGFDPARFLAEDPARPRFAYFPFGGGRRQCIGGGFAMMEATLILAVLASRFRFHLVPGRPVGLDPKVTLRALEGIHVTVHPRPDR